MESRDIIFDLNLDLAIEEAWNFWTDSKKLEQWLTTEAKVNPTLGGSYELFWDPSNPKDNSTLGCKITALVPHKVREGEPWAAARAWQTNAWSGAFKRLGELD